MSDQKPMPEPKYDAADLAQYLPRQTQADLAKATESAGLSKAAGVAFILAGEALRDYCPPGERALVAGILMAMYAREPKA